MTPRRTVEVLSAGCALCEEALEQVRRLACDACDVRVVDVRTPGGEARARALGVRAVPAVAVDGRLAACCAGRGLDEAVLRAAGVGAGSA